MRSIEPCSQNTQARGGVLFVDEAYRLAEGGEHDFGVEAIETMMVEMTKPRTKDSVVFVFAGYDATIRTCLVSVLRLLRAQVQG